MGVFKEDVEEEDVMWVMELIEFFLWGDVDKGGEGNPEWSNVEQVLSMQWLFFRSKFEAVWVAEDDEGGVILPLLVEEGHDIIASNSFVT